jgi:hypothetical protein
LKPREEQAQVVVLAASRPHTWPAALRGLDLRPLLNLRSVPDRTMVIHGGRGLRQEVAVVRCGRFAGPRLGGRVAAGGSECVTWTEERAAHLDGRLVLQVDGNAAVVMTLAGARCGGPFGPEAFRSGDLEFRVQATFRASAPGFTWLNRVAAVGVARVGQRDRFYEIFEVR